MESKVALVTGGARRLGAAIVEALHARDCEVVLHCRASRNAADALAARLNARRSDSAHVLQADLCDPDALERLAHDAIAWRGRVDVLVNSASTFYPTPVGTVTPEHWRELMGSNLRAPFFLAQALVNTLREQHGVIVNLLDIFAERPMPEHPVYSAAKAGHAMLTRSLALELAPDVRVNGVAPGAILWPETQGADDARPSVPDPPELTPEMQSILDRVPLARTGEPADIAGAVSFLALDAPYITGQILAVDGGRSLNM